MCVGGGWGGFTGETILHTFVNHLHCTQVIHNVPSLNRHIHNAVFELFLNTVEYCITDY
jgi:hypothetical protein